LPVSEANQIRFFDAISRVASDSQFNSNTLRLYTDILTRARLDIVSCDDAASDSAGADGGERIRRCLTAGYCLNVARLVHDDGARGGGGGGGGGGDAARRDVNSTVLRKKNDGARAGARGGAAAALADASGGAYQTVLTKQRVHIHPSSALFSRRSQPAFIVYNELVVTTKHYVRECTEIDAAWLPELAPNLFAGDAGAPKRRNLSPAQLTTLGSNSDDADRSSGGANIGKKPSSKSSSSSSTDPSTSASAATSPAPAPAASAARGDVSASNKEESSQKKKSKKGKKRKFKATIV
jgi:hypothetical protein